MPLLTFPDMFVPVQLSSGHSSSCAVSASHECFCWGSGAFGLMGQGNTDDVYFPTKVELGDDFDVEFVELGYGHACGVSTIGDMKVCASLCVVCLCVI